MLIMCWKYDSMINKVDLISGDKVINIKKNS